MRENKDIYSVADRVVNSVFRTVSTSVGCALVAGFCLLDKIPTSSNDKFFYVIKTVNLPNEYKFLYSGAEVIIKDRIRSNSLISTKYIVVKTEKVPNGKNLVTVRPEYAVKNKVLSLMTTSCIKSDEIYGSILFSSEDVPMIESSNWIKLMKKFYNDISSYGLQNLNEAQKFIHELTKPP